MPLTPASAAGWAVAAPGAGAGAAARPPGTRAGPDRPDAPPHRSGRSARRAAGNPALVPRVAHRAEVRALVRGAHGELVHVALADERHAGALELLDEVGVIGAGVVRQHPRAAGRAKAGGAEDVLVRDRD